MTWNKVLLLLVKLSPHSVKSFDKNTLSDDNFLPGSTDS
jgi:hypothetical protein